VSSFDRVRRKLFLADHCLATSTGHHLFYNKALADAAFAEKIDVTVLSAKAFDTSQLAPHKCSPVFATDWRAKPPRFTRRHATLLGLLDSYSLSRFRRALGKAFKKTDWQKGDLIFAQMMTPRHLAAWADWLACLPGPFVPEVFVHVAYDPSRFASHQAFRAAWARLNASRNSDFLRPLTDSSRLVASYRELMDRPVGLLPHVVPSHIFDVPMPATDAVPVFGVLGSPRADKGFPEVAEVILSTARWDNPPRFVVQTGDADEESAPWVEKIIAAKLPHVVIEKNTLNKPELYARLFGSVTVFLLPYRLNVYGVRTSGIFCEALASGRVVIPSDGSWMHDKAKQGNVSHLSVRERNPRDIEDALRSAVASHRELLARACSASADYREEFSAAHFVREMLRMCGSRAS